MSRGIEDGVKDYDDSDRDRNSVKYLSSGLIITEVIYQYFLIGSMWGKLSGCHSYLFG